jgi:hypothetical protein
LQCFGRTLPRADPERPPKPDDDSEAATPCRASQCFAVWQEGRPQIAVTNPPRARRD